MIATEYRGCATSSVSQKTKNIMALKIASVTKIAKIAQHAFFPISGVFLSLCRFSGAAAHRGGDWWTTATPPAARCPSSAGIPP
jgi:hypothetical protein